MDHTLKNNMATSSSIQDYQKFVMRFPDSSQGTLQNITEHAIQNKHNTFSTQFYNFSETTAGNLT